MKSFNLELTTVAMGGPGEYQESLQHEKRSLSAKVINKGLYQLMFPLRADQELYNTVL